MPIPNKNRFILHLRSELYRLDELKDFAEGMERMLVQERKRLNRQVTRKGGSIEDDEVRQIYFEEMSEDWDRLADAFPKLLRASVFSRCVSDFEHALFNLAREHKRQARSEIDLSDLSGDGLKKAAVYFSKVAQVPLPTGSRNWQKLQLAGRVRNLLVHNGGRLQSGQPASQFRALEPEVSVNERQEVNLSEDAASALIDLMKAFLLELQRQVKTIPDVRPGRIG